MGGSQKETSDDEGEGGGVTIPPKIDDVNYEQPLSPRYPKDIPKISPRYLVTSIALILFSDLE